MVLDDPLTAIGAAAFVFFFLLGVLYLWDPDIPGKTWYGILFVLVAVTILLFLIAQPGLAGVIVGAAAGFVGKDVLERYGIGN